jgi:hypothetical protein
MCRSSESHALRLDARITLHRQASRPRCGLRAPSVGLVGLRSRRPHANARIVRMSQTVGHPQRVRCPPRWRACQGENPRAYRPGRRGGRVAEGGGLLNRYTGKPVSWVRIPSSPPALIARSLSGFWPWNRSKKRQRAAGIGRSQDLRFGAVTVESSRPAPGVWPLDRITPRPAVQTPSERTRADAPRWMKIIIQ